MSNADSRSPIGPSENSLAFQRWVNVVEIEMSPVGTAEIFDVAGITARGFFRPCGTRLPSPPIPTVETVGYCRASLRDSGSANATLRSRQEARA
jgi:hypothetical protein